ncbi:tRNA pseudouridine(38-40) synthase TruA [Gemmatimonadota bacterium]
MVSSNSTRMDRSIRGLPLEEQPVKITLEYDGAAYCGWQRQPVVRTVQGDLEQALATVLRTPVTVLGQGRTDSGVHAESQVAHLFLPDPSIDLDDLRKHLNGIMSPTCTVRQMVLAPSGFHARFSATGRRYRYQIIREFSPLRRTTHWFVEGDLDLDVVERGMEACLGEHDFGMFCSHSQDLEHTRCTVLSFSMDRDGTCLTFRIAANRFLHNMVRRLAGEMVVLGRGKRSFDHFMMRLDEPGPADAGLTAPPHALFLEQVIYPDMVAGDLSP